MFGFSLDDMLGIILIYAYIAIVFIIAEKVWKGEKGVGRKILHILMGNIVFALWLFDHRNAEILIAGTALLFSLLITQRMQKYFLKWQAPGQKGILSKLCQPAIERLSMISVSGAGNEFGLVYYCLVFTVLAFLFFRTPIVIAVGILPMAYGDGLGAVVGMKYGRHPYRIIDKKSLEGSMAVFLGTALVLPIGMAFYGMPLLDAIWRSALIGLIVAIVEGIAPRGLDNLAIPACAVALFLLLGGPA